MSQPESKADYEVGYGKPPKEHRFQKGRSGNPRGRPKGSRNFRTVIESALTKTQPIREDGKVRYLPDIEIIILQLVAKALKGGSRRLRRFYGSATSTTFSAKPPTRRRRPTLTTVR